MNAAPASLRRAGRLTIGRRLFLGLAPALLAVVLVVVLAHYGEYGRQAPGAVVVGAGALALASLGLTWRNARAIAARIARLAGPADGAAAGAPPDEDELDRIAATVDRLGSALSASEAGRVRASAEAASRLREEAALVAAAADAAIGRLDELRLPLHILLENRFGDLNENQVELLADARAAAERMDAELRRLRTVADADRGALSVARGLVQVNDVLRGVLPGVVGVARRRGGRVDVALEPGLPPVYADRARLHQAMALLLADAVARAHGGAVTVTTARVGDAVVVGVAPGAPAGGDSPDALLARRLLGAQGASTRAAADRVEVTFAG